MKEENVFENIYIIRNSRRVLLVPTSSYFNIELLPEINNNIQTTTEVPFCGCYLLLLQYETVFVEEEDSLQL